jgi:hypothetical protein
MTGGAAIRAAETASPVCWWLVLMHEAKTKLVTPALSPRQARIAMSSPRQDGQRFFDSMFTEFELNCDERRVSTKEEHYKWQKTEEVKNEANDKWQETELECLELFGFVFLSASRESVRQQRESIRLCSYSVGTYSSPGMFSRSRDAVDSVG